MPAKYPGARCAAIAVGIMDLSKIPLFAMLTERMAWLNQRQAVLAQNIANADTPGYKPKDLAPVDFKQLAEAATRRIAITATDSRHLAGVSRARAGFSETRQTDTYETSPSGNAVVLEEQLMKVTETVMNHQIIANLYTKHVNMIRMVLGRTG